MSEAKEYKMVVMGGGGVGKSALTIRLISGKFLDEYDPTIEDSYRKTVSIDGKAAILDILDTAGQDEFAAMRDIWIRESKGFLLVYTITLQSTFDDCKQLFQQILRIKEDELDDIVVVLAGNKCDLTNARSVSMKEGQNLVNEWNKDGIKASFFETSAKASINNEECYYEIIRLLRQKEQERGNEDDQPVKPDGGCCNCCQVL